MNISSNNNKSVVSSRDGIFINGEKIETPKSMNKNSQSQTIIDNKIYINGFEYDSKKKKFKRSFLALWYFLF